MVTFKYNRRAHSKRSHKEPSYREEDDTRWFKYDWDDLYVNKSQFVPVIFEPPCIKMSFRLVGFESMNLFELRVVSKG
jgi:hypothetical protein